MEEGTSMLQRINNTLGRIMVSGDELSWDFSFLESLREQADAGRSLSARQEEILQQVEGRYSDEALVARGNWENSWNSEKEDKFSIALYYYQKTGYYNNIVNRYLDAESKRIGVPLEKEYNKLVLNKYASGVIENVLGDCKFPVGSTAAFRANANRLLQGKLCIVLQHGSGQQVRTHAKGAKPVHVLLIGSSDPVWTEERFLKKPKKRK
tara:strand:+ start:97 stop:723 length:627 start_codon:yes stop_codon:yes gene_type:complete